MGQPFNFQALEDFLNRDIDDISVVQQWSEKLDEYDLDGNESSKELDLLMDGMKYVMSYSLTAAEELKELAEREAAAMAEKEEMWEEQRAELKDELAGLRDRITVSADAGESSEAFRAQIDSLKEENRELQLLNRDRDREMADQRDRFESLVARADMLTRERDSLLDHRVQLEDTIRELNRRLSSKSDDATNEWESKKLRQRNEQAVTLSRQMQAVVAQNESLRTEAERVSAALEDATRLIEASSERIRDLSSQLSVVQESDMKHREEVQSLSALLAEQTGKVQDFESKVLDSDQVAKSKIHEQAVIIEEERMKLRAAQAEYEDLRARISADTTAEKEKELEKLKVELVKATKMARALFGETSATVDGGQKGVEGREGATIRAIQLEMELEKQRQMIEEFKMAAVELEESAIQKDIANSEIAAEVERLRELKFGDARQELSRLETQLRIRDSQIGRLSNQCTMLQIELGRYAEGLNTQLDTQSNRRSERMRETVQTLMELRKGDKGTDDTQPRESTEEEETQRSRETEEEADDSSIKKPDREIVHVVDRLQRSQSDWEQQAMLISGLYYELMTVLEELDSKNKQTIEMQHALTTGKKAVEESKAKLKLAYEEIVSLKKLLTSEVTETESKEETNVELSELRHFAESIKFGGTDLERRAEEATRKLIAERMEKIRISRSCKALRSRCTRAEAVVLRLRERMTTRETQTAKQLAKLQYEMDTSCMDLAVAQNRLLQSVPLETYERLSKKYRKLVKESILGPGNADIDDTIPLAVDFSVRKTDLETSEELQTKNTYLKKMVAILSDQNDFWSSETELLQRENEELKRFLEDLENESDVKGVLVAIEQRLLETIREQSEAARVQAREQRQRRDTDEERTRREKQRKMERRIMLHTIEMLQRSIQSQRDNSLATVTLQQMEVLRGKILEIRESEKYAVETRQKVDKMRDDLEKQLINSKSTRRARDAVEGESIDNERVQRTLQNAYNSAATQTARAERLQTTLRNRESELEQLRSELDELQRENEKVLTIVASRQFWSIKDSETSERESRKAITESVVVEQSPVDAEYEMDLESESSESASTASSSSRIIVKTVVNDNSKEFQFRLNQMKSAAEECIQGYKDQLVAKEAALESYRMLLQSRMESTVREGERARNEKRVADNERAGGDTEQRLLDAIAQIARLEQQVSELESANMELYRERRTGSMPTVKSTYMQTDELDIVSGRVSSRLESERQPPMREVAETQRSEVSDLVLSERRDETMKYRNEIRKQQERIRRLTATNKGLVAACEKIKSDAITSLMSRQEKSISEENMQERIELDRIRKENRMLKKRMEELQRELTEMERAKEKTAINKTEEISKWHERKKTEESIGVLRRKLKESQEKLLETQEILSKREKRLDEMRSEAESRQRDIERLNRRMKELKSERDSSIRDNQQVLILKDRQIFYEETIRQREKELSQLRSRIKSLEETNETLRKSETLGDSTVPKGEDKRNKEKVLRRQHTVPAQQIETVTVIQRDVAREKVLEQRLQDTQRLLKTSESKCGDLESKVQLLDKEHSLLSESYAKLSKKIAARDQHATGAVAVLGDKLEAKDREITNLKIRISALERRLSQ